MLTYKNRITDVAVLCVAMLFAVSHWTEEMDNTDYASFPVLKTTQQDQTEHWPGQVNGNDDASCPFLKDYIAINSLTNANSISTLPSATPTYLDRPELMKTPCSNKSVVNVTGIIN
jgi:hypothetical protein